MPQMSPMWWTSLSLMFNLILILMFSMNYFNKNKTSMKSKKIMKKKMNWKW